MILLTCEILKNDTSNLFTKQKLRLKKQTWLPREKVGGKEQLGSLGLTINTTIFKIDNHQGTTV